MTALTNSEAEAEPLEGGERSTGVATGRLDRTDWSVLAVLAIVAGSLRFFRLGANSLWVDEIRAVLRPDGLPFLESIRQSFGPLDPPLSYAVTAAARHLPGGLEFVTRVPAALAGVAEVVFSYLIMCRLARRRLEAVVAGTLLAVAPFAVRWSQEARYYTLFSALALASWWAFLRVLDRQRYAFTIWAVVAVLAVYTNVLAWLVLAIQGVAYVVVVVRRSRAGIDPPPQVLRAVGALAVPVLAFVPWVIYEASYWIPARRRGVPIEFNREALDVQLNGELFVDAWRWLLGNGNAVLATATFATVVLAFMGRRWRLAVALLAYCATVIVAMVALSRVMHTYVAFRRVEFLVPALIGVVALGVGALSDRVGQWLRGRWGAEVAAVAMTALLVACSLPADVAYFGTEKTDYRQLAQVVRDAPDGDVVVLGRFNEVGNAPWAPSIQAYLRTAGVDRPVRTLGDLSGVPASGTALWITGAPAPDARFRTEALNDVSDLQFLVGDRSLKTFGIPVYVLRSSYDSPAELQSQAQVVAGLPYTSVPSG